MNSTLLAPFTDDEIKAAAHQLWVTKAPGPDGFPGIFYSKFWNIVQNLVCETSHDFQNGHCHLAELNKTYIALIPKTPAPENTNQFRPIGLCNNSYFPHCNFLQAKKGSRSSWAWASLIEGRDALLMEAKFQIFNGATTNIWKDNWISVSNSGVIKPTCPVPITAPQLVCEIMDKPNHSWNLDLIADCLDRETINLIRSTPISLSPRHDRLVWPWNPNGSFSVRSGYH
ncbi:unnamed protein product, partial [Prunus brigantina]